MGSKTVSIIQIRVINAEKDDKFDFLQLFDKLNIPYIDAVTNDGPIGVYFDNTTYTGDNRYIYIFIQEEKIMISKNRKYTNLDRYKVDVIDNLKELYKKIRAYKRYG